MLIKRMLSVNLLEAAREFPVIAIIGPRHSGKTTLAQMSFPEHRYISLEDYDVRERAKLDPRAFLSSMPSTAGIILDEIQHVPELLSYIQTIVDREKKNGFFIVTGSQNFLVDEAITQTLAGRMVVLTLLPFSLAELTQASLLPTTLDQTMHTGFYPRAYVDEVTINRLYSNYIRLYVERDVRQIRNVADLGVFQKFMRVCAGRIGQIVDFVSLGNDCGIDQKTVKAWISLLEASYIIFRLQPYYRNYGKSLIKSSKLYFYDTGIACSLLNIATPEELAFHYMRGSLFESMIIGDILKQHHNRELQPGVYFWRDKPGHELDCVVEQGPEPVPIEIKSGQTVASDFFKNLTFWHETTKQQDVPRVLVYGGAESYTQNGVQVFSWRDSGELILKTR